MRTWRFDSEFARLGIRLPVGINLDYCGSEVPWLVRDIAATFNGYINFNSTTTTTKSGGNYD
jgi:hypothetical protein